MNPSFLDLFQTITDILNAARADWGSLHPLIVHFPIALLCVVPLFILAGLLMPANRKSLYATTLLLLWLGTASLLLSFSSGEVASESVAKGTEAFATLKLHYNLAELSRNMFLALTGIFTLYFFLASWLEQTLKATGHNLLLWIFLFGYLAGLLVLTNAAHQGGKLVHKHGVHSTLYRHIEK